MDFRCFRTRVAAAREPDSSNRSAISSRAAVGVICEAPFQIPGATLVQQRACGLAATMIFNLLGRLQGVSPVRLQMLHDTTDSFGSIDQHIRSDRVEKVWNT